MDDISSGGARAVSARSCTACKRRKIRCNREQPCNYCTKLRLECTYVITGKDAITSPPKDMLTRLERIEASLQRIEAQTAPQTITNRSSFVAEEPSLNEQTVHDATKTQKDGAIRKNVASGSGVDSLWTKSGNAMNVSEVYSNDLATEIGSRSSPTGLDYHGLIFGTDTMTTETSDLHPTEDRIFALWQVFIECADPLIKMVHVPTTQRQLLRACQNLSTVPPSFESLMFAIYYAAVISMQSSVSHKNLSIAERQEFLQRYRDGLIRSLTKANLMRAPDIITLQALTIYLTCARQIADKMYVWSMTGLLIRLATKLGLHRDPTAFGVRPFPAEMRRRLWWQICILDVRTAEECDMDPFICEHAFDTKFPSNVNDSDLDMSMTQPPAQKSTRTEMLFTLTRLEISYNVRKLVFSSDFTANNGYDHLSTQQKNDTVDGLFDNLKAKYLHDSDDEIPICYLNSIAAEMVLAKLKLTINHPSRLEKNDIPRERLVQLVRSAISIVQYARGLRSDKTYARWVWLFQKYVEWDAVAFLLHAMNAVQMPAIAEKAWHEINLFFTDWSDQVPERENRWQRLLSLRNQAAVNQSVRSEASETGMTHPAGVPDIDHRPTLQSSNPKEPVRQSQTVDQDFLATSRAPFGHDVDVRQDATGEESGLWSFDDGACWTYDGSGYSGMQAANTWEMNIDESVFGSSNE